MHNIDTKKNILCLGTLDFNNTFNELKEYLNFNLTFAQDIDLKNLEENTNILLIDSDLLKEEKILNKLKETDITKLLIAKPEFKKDNCGCDVRLELPIKFSDLNIFLNEIITKKKYSDNSSISIKDYILDKNEKKLKKNKKFIIITEKEIQLLELLFDNKKPVSKKEILKSVWRYAEDADTHTVETHIYRLRKKILNVFTDENFIINKKNGYLI
jgi:hypothetical protein